MKLFLAFLVYAIMALILGCAMVMAVAKGSVLVLAVCLLVFIVAFAKIGCMDH